MEPIQNFTEQFLAFAKTKPADATYDPCNCEHCALAQFVHSLRPGVYTGPRGYASTEVEYHRSLYRTNDAPLYPQDVYGAVLHHDVKSPWTWGALTERLQAL